MTTCRLAIAAGLGAALMVAQSIQGAQPAAPKYYNTVKQKLSEGKQVVGGTVSIPDPETYCAVANAGFDFTWIEMQHSPLTYQDAARMIFACRGAAAVPFIRVADATEGDIQKATDIGALGIILPMVDTVEKAEAAVKFSKYPPVGRRSQGAGQYGALWGSSYRETANDNIMIVAMIENPAGASIVKQIASVPGVDVVFVASTDLGKLLGPAPGRSEVRGDGDDGARDDDRVGPEGRGTARVERQPQGIFVLPGPERGCADPVRRKGIARGHPDRVSDDGRRAD